MSLILLASAGSGKTQRLIDEVDSLLKNHINPEKILIISYTKNAVEEIIHRLKIYYPQWKEFWDENQLNNINCTTFHGFCLDFIKEINHDMAIELTEKPHNLHDLIPKNLLQNYLNPWEITEFFHNISTEQLFFTYNNYDEYIENFPFEYKNDQWLFIQWCVSIINFIKNTFNLWTFSDLIVFMDEILNGKNSTNYLWLLWQKYDSIFIDECQDFSPMQLSIITKIFNEFIFNNYHSSKKWFFIFADPKQSIFNFQGANLSYFKYFINNLKNLSNNHHYHLREENLFFTHRLPVSHVNLINKLFPLMDMEDFQDHYTQNIHQGLVQYYNPKPSDHNDNVINKIGTLIESLLEEGYEKEDIMIIFRNRDNLIYNLSNWLKNKNYSIGLDLISSNNNNVIILLNHIYELINNKLNIDILLSFSSNYFFYYLDENTIKILLSLENIHEIINNLSTQIIIENFFTWMNNIPNPMDIHPYDFIMDILSLEIFNNICSKDDQNIIFNLLEISKNFNGNWLEFVNNLPDNFKTENQGVVMETIYGSKGLQRKIIIIADGNKGPIYKDWQYKFLYKNQQGSLNKFINPNVKNQWLMEKNNEIFQEYKRLMYVAMTRSQDRLYIFGSYPLEHSSLIYYLQQLQDSGYPIVG